MLGSFTVCCLILAAQLARTPTDWRPGLIRSLAPQIGELVREEYHSRSTGVAIIERTSPLSPDTKIAPPAGMRERSLGPGETTSGSSSYLRDYLGEAGGPPCTATIYAIDDPSAYEREVGNPDLTDAIRSRATYGYSLSIDCAQS